MTTKDFPCSLHFAWRPPWAFVKLSDFQMRMRSGCYLSRHIRKFALICQIITHAQRQKSEIAGFSPSYVLFDLWLPGFLKLIHAACLDCAWCSLVQISVLPKPRNLCSSVLSLRAISSYRATAELIQYIKLVKQLTFSQFSKKTILDILVFFCSILLLLLIADEQLWMCQTGLQFSAIHRLQIIQCYKYDK